MVLKVGHPSGFEQRNQPGLVLARNRHRTGNRQRQRAAHADRLIENGVDPPQKRAAESGQAVRENLVEGVAFIDAANAHRMAMGHRF